jgi:hypothetical protein
MFVFNIKGVFNKRSFFEHLLAATLVTLVLIQIDKVLKLVDMINVHIQVDELPKKVALMSCI